MKGLTLSTLLARRFDLRCHVSESQPSLQPVFVPPKSREISSWQTEYEKTLWELDEEKLLSLIHATEGALFRRWQELGNDPGHTQERIGMEAAAEDLLALKIHKLGWPNPCN
jgi:hypothetical protein